MLASDIVAVTSIERVIMLLCQTMPLFPRRRFAALQDVARYRGKPGRGKLSARQIYGFTA
jgi:hypothetical protein